MATKGNPMAGKGDGKKESRGAVALWESRRRRTGVHWIDVDGVTLKACLATCVANDVAIMISGASGGTGVCVTIWVDRVRHKEYANDAGELMELLNGVTDAYSSHSEDIRVVVGGSSSIPDEEPAAATD